MGVPNQARLNRQELEQPRPSNAGFDQADPTQSPPDIRRVLEGEREQVRRDPPPPIIVVGKVVRSGGAGMALLRINERVFMVEVGTRFSVPTTLAPIAYTITTIDAKGVTLQTDDKQQTQRLP